MIPCCQSSDDHGRANNPRDRQRPKSSPLMTTFCLLAAFKEHCYHYWQEGPGMQSEDRASFLSFFSFFSFIICFVFVSLLIRLLIRVLFPYYVYLFCHDSSFFICFFFCSSLNIITSSFPLFLRIHPPSSRFCQATVFAAPPQSLRARSEKSQLLSKHFAIIRVVST